jgi:hypothetical protein
MKKILLVPTVVALALSAPLPGGTQKESPPGKEPAPEPSRLQQFMQRKRQLSHEVFDALVLKDFKRIARNANALYSLSRADDWEVRKTPRYMEYTTAFREAAEKLGDQARDNNLDEAARAFSDMTLCCVRCHEYVRTKR